jgi:AbrB family looped-hinge helix DNA binding protein
MSSGTLGTVEFLATARLGEKGQLTIPKEYRNTLALQAGSPISVLQIGNGLLLIPEQARFRELCERIARVFSEGGLTAGEVMSTLPQARAQVYARRYPELARRKRRTRAGKRKS